MLSKNPSLKHQNHSRETPYPGEKSHHCHEDTKRFGNQMNHQVLELQPWGQNHPNHSLRQIWASGAWLDHHQQGIKPPLRVAKSSLTRRREAALRAKLAAKLGRSQVHFSTKAVNCAERFSLKSEREFPKINVSMNF